MDDVREDLAREIQPAELLDDGEGEGQGRGGFEGWMADEGCEAPCCAGFEGGFEEDVEEGEGEEFAETAGVAGREGFVGLVAILDGDGETGEEDVEEEEEERWYEEEA